MINIDAAVKKGLDIVQEDDDIDLDAEDAVAFYERFVDRARTLSLFDAVVRTAHDAFLTGVVTGKEH